MLSMFNFHLLIEPFLKLIAVCKIRVIFKLGYEIIEVMCETQIIEHISKLIQMLRLIIIPLAVTI